MTPQEILEYIRSAGITGILILIIVGGWRRWWVWGWHYQQIEKERDEWKSLAIGGTHLSERAVRAAQEVVGE